MAAGAVMYTFQVQLADVDHALYEDFTLRVARHPSETDAYMALTDQRYRLLQWRVRLGLTEQAEMFKEINDLTARPADRWR